MIPGRFLLEFAYLLLDVKEAAHAATQTSSAAEQQLVGVKPIGLTTQSIQAVAAQNVGGVQQLERAAEELNTLAQQLRASVG